MKKKMLVLIAASLLICGCGKIPTTKDGKEAVVTFKDGTKISADELYSDLKATYGFTLLINKIDTKILNDEYPDEEEGQKSYADNYISYIKSNYETDEDYLSYIQNIGFNSEAELINYLKLTYLRNLAIEDYGKAQVTDDEINDYYETDIFGDIKVGHILIEPQVKDDMTDEQKKDEEDKALKTAKDLVKQIKDAEDHKAKFEELAKDKSADEGSAKNNGSLGFINKGSIGTEFEDAAYKLKDGEYTTTPVKATDGYHIIYRYETKEKAKLKEVKTKIIETLGQKKLTDNQELQIDALTELRKKYDLEIVDTDLSTNYANYIQNQIANLKKNK